MLILADTNLLLRLAEPGHVHHDVSAAALRLLRDLEHRFVLVPQVIYEFWSVATRPLDVNGLGLSAGEVESKLVGFTPAFQLLRDERAIFEIWQRLVIAHDVKGKQVHDARLVAAMLRHDITHVLTFNVADFARYSEITVVEPQRAGELDPAEQN